MEPITIAPGHHRYVSVLDAVSYFIGDPAYLVWYTMSEVVTAILEPPDMFQFILADGRRTYIEQTIRICVYHRPLPAA